MSKIQYNKLTTEKFIEKSISIHGKIYDYSKVDYNGSLEYVNIICKKHGDFKQLPTNHYRYGCGKCGRETKNKYTINLKTKCKNEFITKANNVHKNKYDYSNSEYITAIKKLIVICKNHGEFKISPNNHLRGKGCPSCGREISSKSKLKTYKEYYKYFIEKHGDKYDYSKVEWINACAKIIVICKKHGEFKIIPWDHKAGKGCSSCSNQYSKKAIKWLEYISSKNNIKIQHAENIGEKYIFGKTKVDGYCEENNTVYEFHGDFWHGNPSLYNQEQIHPRNGKKFGELFKKTLHKELKIRNLGYNYVCIWENIWDKINNN